MAEFKISRLRYTWKNAWTTATAYLKDDIVRYGGGSWVCMRQHTAGIFASDQTYLANPGDSEPTPAWRKMTDGYLYRGEWTTSTLYNPGDVVKYGGNLYLTVTSFTSGALFNSNVSNVALYATGYNYRQAWQQNTRYGVNDVVKYGGNIYRCIIEHTSDTTSNGLEANSSNWSTSFEGIDFKGLYDISTRYKVNDLVLRDGTLLRCLEGYTSSSSFDSTKWEVDLLGSEFNGEWNSGTYYGVGSVVRHGGYIYTALKASYGQNPYLSSYQAETNDPYWQKLSENYNWRGVWGPNTSYKTGDVVRRGGVLYVAILDTTADGSSTDYLDTSNWEILDIGQNSRGSWSDGQTYAAGDLVQFSGDVYKCNFEHLSSDQNYPGDSGSGFVYWDMLIQSAGPNVGLRQLGDLLTYDLSRSLAGDTSTFGVTNLEIGNSGEILSINDENSAEYRVFGSVSRVFYVGVDGIDDDNDTVRGTVQSSPWRTIRYACLRADDGFSGFTTINVGVGVFEEILPIVVPKRTVVLGSELRSTIIKAASADTTLSSDRTYFKAGMNRLSAIMQSLIAQITLSPAKTNTNSLNPTTLGLDTGQETGEAPALAIQELIVKFNQYIDYHIAGTGTNPTLTGSNDETNDDEYLNAALVLAANRSFCVNEVVKFLQATYPLYSLNETYYRKILPRIIDSFVYDIKYTGNYKTLREARGYVSAVEGSTSEDMFYMRDATGLRDCTLKGLTGILNPPTVFDLYRRPTGGSFVSLDPGWGPSDENVWITTRSPYIQGVTNIGTACIGQKIDGALHNGGNKSMVSNDFTQVLSDGIGALVKNNGRAELVSVFTYYCTIGYLAENGGIIRGTNGNCSYGNYGAIADGNDSTETPQTIEVNNRNNQAIVANAFAGEFVDEIQVLEFYNAGERYKQAGAAFLSAGVGASVSFEDFRDQAIFEARPIDVSTNPAIESIGGGGYSIIQGNAQVHLTLDGDLTSITIASNDINLEADYLGKRIIIVSGTGTGQYGYITAYNTTTKVVSVSKDSTGTPGWDHMIAGKPLANPFDTTTRYRIEPRITFAEPNFSVSAVNTTVSTFWSDICFGELTQNFTNVQSDSGTGTVIDVPAAIATFDVSQVGREYSISLNSGGAGYAVGDILIIEGNTVGGQVGINDITITVTDVSDDSTNSILGFSFEGTGHSGKYVAVSLGGSAAVYSANGTDWNSINLPSSGDWIGVAAGNNRFVAIRYNSNACASSFDGINWTARTMPASRNWTAVAYGGGKFVAVSSNQNSAAYSLNGQTWLSASMPVIGDSTINEWIDIAYGKGRFVAIANSNNVAAYSDDGITWSGTVMDVVADSSQRDWVSVAYGNNRWVTISSQGDCAYSFDGITWYPSSIVTQDGSTAHSWTRIRYGQGVFFAVGSTGNRTVGGDPTADITTFAATSPDGITWTGRNFVTEGVYTSIALGNPYIELDDSSTGASTPLWVAIADSNSNFQLIRTGARALGRVEVQSGLISKVKFFDTGSGYREPPAYTITDPSQTSAAVLEIRLGDGVLTNPEWINRGSGYRTAGTTVTISGNGYADVYPVGKFVTVNELDFYPKPGAQIQFSGNTEVYQLVSVEELGAINGGLSAVLRISPNIKTRDFLSHGTSGSIRIRYSQVRITGHDFLDVGTGNFEETNYPELYATGVYQPTPENEVYEESGGRVFYTSTDQSGNFRAGELFAVEQATGIVTISADFFDLSGLTELRIGGVRLGGSGVVIREFSTDALFTADSNNIVPTQKAIAAYLNNRLTVGGSEIATSNFIAGFVRVGPDLINHTLTQKIIVPVRADFETSAGGVKGSIVAQAMFFKSFNQF